MSRTTLDIDAPVLRELSRLRKQTGKSLGQIASELMAQSLAKLGAKEAAAPYFSWIARPMRARVDLDDKEQVYRVLDTSESSRR